ncbi:alpha/beta fold hydrolase, partial [Staphylococcus pseudintermedius]
DPHFPKKLKLRDIVRANERGIQALGYDKINILIGGSLGGMQAMELLYNQQFEVDKAIILAATSRTSSYS